MQIYAKALLQVNMCNLYFHFSVTPKETSSKHRRKGRCQTISIIDSVFWRARIRQLGSNDMYVSLRVAASAVIALSSLSKSSGNTKAGN
eukprot:6491943-Amphidinium_carterae.1